MHQARQFSILVEVMLTKEELEQLGQVIDARLDVKLRAEREQTRIIVREELAANNTVLGTIVRVEIKASEQKLTKKIEAVEQKLDDILADHETRIKSIETPEVLPRSH